MGDSDAGWVTISPDDSSSTAKNKLDNVLANKLSISEQAPAHSDQDSLPEEDNENDTAEVTGGSAAAAVDVENGNHDTEEATDVAGDATGKKKKISPLKFLRKISSKELGGAGGEAGTVERLPSKSKARRTSQIPLELQVDSLPQMFVTKYLGSAACRGLWGIQHTHGPTTNLVDAVGRMKKDEDLPLVQLHVSSKGIGIMMHKENRGRLLEEGMIPVEFISYGVQDIKFTRVFCYILVKEMSWRAKKMEVHAYVCDSTATCRRLSLSVALAFKEYAATLGGQPYKFRVDLRPPTELEKELDEPDANAEADA